MPSVTSHLILDIGGGFHRTDLLNGRYCPRASQGTGSERCDCIGISSTGPLPPAVLTFYGLLPGIPLSAVVGPAGA